jgi:SulP family sulfate permease
VFYLVLGFTGVSPEQARRSGWLQTLPLAEDAEHSLLFQLQILGQADFTVFFRQVDLLAAILMTSVVSILLTASALEISAREEIDLNRELRVAGLANLASGFGGGMVGFHSLSLSQLVINLGGRGRFIGLMSAAICAVAFFFGSYFIEYIPLFVCGGLLFFLGLSFLWEWLVEGYRRFNTLDYIVILLIVGVTSVAGYPAGVGTGILLATILFIHNYSQVDIVTNAFRGGDVTSNVDRPITQIRELRRQGDSIYALMLQGYIFFGTANHLLDVVRRKQAELPEGSLRYVVLDFHRVTGIDSSAMMSLTKIRGLAMQKDLRVLLTHLNDAVAKQLHRSGFFREENQEDPVLMIFEDLDHGLEYCENRVLGLSSIEQLGETCPLPELFTTGQHTAEEARELLKYMDRHEVASGEVIIRQDDPPDRLYYLESGVVTVSLELNTGKMLRLRKMGAGTFIGEIGLYLQVPRTAFVIAATPCVLYSLSQEALDRLKREQPELGASFHHFMVGILAERLSDMGKIVKTLLD